MPVGSHHIKLLLPLTFPLLPSPCLLPSALSPGPTPWLLPRTPLPALHFGCLPASVAAPGLRGSRGLWLTSRFDSFLAAQALREPPWWGRSGQSHGWPGRTGFKSWDCSQHLGGRQAPLTPAGGKCPADVLLGKSALSCGLLQEAKLAFGNSLLCSASSCVFCKKTGPWKISPLAGLPREQKPVQLPSPIFLPTSYSLDVFPQETE